MTARASRFEVDLARFRIADQGVGWRRLAFGRRSLPTRSRNHAMNVFGNRDHVVIGNRQWWHTAFGASAAHPAGYVPGILMFAALGFIGLTCSFLLWRVEHGPEGHGLDTIKA